MSQEGHRPTKPSANPTRAKLVERLRLQLERRGYPRLQMMLLVALTGGAGFLNSFLMLTYGVEAMPARYMISVAVAYVVFLTLLWLWMRGKAEDYEGAEELIDYLPDGTPRASPWQGGGGRFGGGGATGRYSDESVIQEYPAGATEASLPAASFDLEPISKSASAAEVSDEVAIPIFLLVLLGAMVLASFSIVYAAPVLFAELLLDGVLATTLYRRLKKLETRHWLQTALRRTLGPFILVAILLGLVGVAMSQYAPHARSLGDVLRYATQR